MDKQTNLATILKRPGHQSNNVYNMLKYFFDQSIFVFLFSLVFLIQCTNESVDYPYRSWAHYNGDKMGSKYSALDQISKSNVKDLKVSWKFVTEDLDASAFSIIECNPLILDEIVYFVSPTWRSLQSMRGMVLSDGDMMWIRFIKAGE
ncbi:MAG: hypothetical protein IPL46_07155 [Saprospiraceae bacterium]|nr:hypothetical protein [Saprospiraceae bacterium]